MNRLLHEQRGHSLISLLGGLSLLALLLVGAGSLRGVNDRRATEMAALELTALMRHLSLEAMTSGRARALKFAATPSGEPMRIVHDGDGDGIAASDIADGTDPIGPSFTLGRQHPGVKIGRPKRLPLPSLPPSSSITSPSENPVRFGSARLAVFSPEGSASPGSIYVSDGHSTQCAVVVFGATSRIRTWCYLSGTRSWQLR